MSPAAPALPILSLAIRTEADVVLVRQRARLVSELLGLDAVNQTRVATAVSEIARNALVHGGGGTARFSATATPPALRIEIQDRGPGMSLSAPQARRGGGGVGVLLARRLMDEFGVDSRSEGAGVTMAKLLPAGRPPVTPAVVNTLVDELLRRPPESLLEELHQQHQELLAVLEDLQRQQDGLKAANAELEETNRGVLALYAEVTRELEDTNRGVMALYAQLDDQAEELRRVNALKDRFLSHLSHEFRTPLNSALALSRLLLDRVDGPLTPEQEVQVRFIRGGAEELLEMVNDLLDLAKIEAGRMELRLEEFHPADLIGALRGMFRPLAAEAGLGLVVVDPDPPLPPAYTDRGKLGRILRNLLSNAVKYTEEGQVELHAAAGDDDLVFTVSDTGPGLAPDELESIFQHFVRGAGDARGVEGTGLGLPLSRELAELLGGELSAESRPGVGSTFRVRVPRRLPAEASTAAVTGSVSPEALAAAADPLLQQPRRRMDAEGSPVVLVVDDDRSSRYVVERVLAPAGCAVVHAETAAEGLSLARAMRPTAIFLDLALPDESGFDLLHRLKEDPVARDSPVIIYTSQLLGPEEIRSLGGAAVRVIRKSDPELLTVLATVGDALARLRSRTEGERP